MEQGLAVLDGRAITGTLLTAGAAVSTWVEMANAYGQLVLTIVGIVVGVATLWYTIERALKLRKERSRGTK